MIEAKEVRKKMWSFSGRIIGENKVENMTNEEIEEQIKNDIKECFADVSDITIYVNNEPIEDARSTKSCSLFVIEMLIVFLTDTGNYKKADLIANYIEGAYVNKLVENDLN